MSLPRDTHKGCCRSHLLAVERMSQGCCSGGNVRAFNTAHLLAVVGWGYSSNLSHCYLM